MRLKAIWPIDMIKERLEREMRIKETTDFEEIVVLKSQCVQEIGATVWDRYVASPDCKHDPAHFADLFDNGDPQLIRAIEELLGVNLMKEIYYGRAEVVDKKLKYKTASEILVCELWPSTLHVADIEFSNPYRPVEQGTALPYQKYKGIGLLPEMLDRAEAYCKKNGLGAISLTAATQQHFPFFQQYGFKIADTPAAAVSEAVGAGVPMIRTVN